MRSSAADHAGSRHSPKRRCSRHSFFFYAGQKASEDNRNAVTIDTDLDMVVLWVRMKVPSRNSDFLILASPCRFWPMFLQRKRSSPLLLEAYLVQWLSDAACPRWGELWIFSDNCSCPVIFSLTVSATGGIRAWCG